MGISQWSWRPVAGGGPPQVQGLEEADPSCGPDAAQIEAQLARLLKSAAFKTTERNKKFLSYIVNQTINGQQDRIKAYSIAIDVFGRSKDFDAHSDPIVRMEAGSLRRALDGYYLTDGIHDDVVITIPKGGYVPALKFRTSVRKSGRPSRWVPTLALASAVLAIFFVVTFLPNSRPARDAPDVPRLVIAPFVDLNMKGAKGDIAAALTTEILGQSAKFKDLAVIDGADTGRPAAGQLHGAQYALLGTVVQENERVRVATRLVWFPNGSVIWADTFERDLRASSTIDAVTNVARDIVTAVAQQPYGTIFQAEAVKGKRSAIDDDAYGCTMFYYRYRVGLDAKTHPAIRKCLERAVSKFPDYATAWALLSQTYIDEVRFRFPSDSPTGPASLDRALDAARRAVALDPDNVRALQAEMLALFFKGQFEAALEIGKRARAINPNDTELMGEYGFRLAMTGDWESGCQLIQQARDRNPGPLSYFEAALALCAYFREDYPTAKMWINKTAMPDNPSYHQIAAVIYGEAGPPEAARRERDWLLENAPAIVANIRNEITARFLRAEDRARIFQSFRKAGLPVPEGQALAN